MVSRCEDVSECPDGNCIGCWDSKLWCLDSRCHPNCHGCSGDRPLNPTTPDKIQPNDTGHTPTNTTDSWKLVLVGVIFFVLVILSVLFIWFMWNKYGTSTETLPQHVVTQPSYSNNMSNSRIYTQPLTYDQKFILSNQQSSGYNPMP